MFPPPKAPQAVPLNTYSNWKDNELEIVASLHDEEDNTSYKPASTLSKKKKVKHLKKKKGLNGGPPSNGMIDGEYESNQKQ